MKKDIMVVLSALQFAAEKHSGQLRHDGKTPYINHPIAVANMIAQTGGVSDPAVIAAALLHDTIEDTGVTVDELSARFGEEIAGIVQECSDDKSLPKMERKRRQILHAASLSRKACIVKLADKICNLQDLIHKTPADWPLQRQREYVTWSCAVVANMQCTNEALREKFVEVAAAAKARYGMKESASQPAC